MTDLIPEEALASHIAILAKTGAGKSVAARGVIEKLFRAGRRCVVIDPTGVWWGIRLDPEGVGPGLPFVIFGPAAPPAAHQPDVIISASDGETVGRVIAEGSFSAVIETKRWSVADRTRFFTDLAGSLMRHNARAMHLVIDEAHLFAPKGKIASPQAGKMLAAANELASGGRALGFRIMWISQRPAKLHNDALASVETLVAMRMLLPHDRDAVAYWMKHAADPKEGKELLESLSQLDRGEAWVWYPEGDYLARGRFPMHTTFDSSAAPEDDEEVIHPINLGEIDLAGIQSAMIGAPLESAPAPAEEGFSKESVEAAERAGYDAGYSAGVRDGEKEGYSEGFRHGVSHALAQLRPVILTLEEKAYSEEESSPLEKLIHADERAEPRVVNLADRRPPAEAPQAAPPRPAPPAPKPAAPAGGPLSGPQLAILSALVWTENFLRMDMAPRVVVGFLAGASPKASGFQNNLGALRTAGLIAYPTGGMVQLSPEGRRAAPAVQRAGTSAELKKAIIERLPGPQADIFEFVWRHWPQATNREAIAAGVGKSATASGFQNNLGALRTLGLITYPVPGEVRAAEHLFPPPQKR